MCSFSPDRTGTASRKKAIFPSRQALAIGPSQNSFSGGNISIYGAPGNSGSGVENSAPDMLCGDQKSDPGFRHSSPIAPSCDLISSLLCLKDHRLLFLITVAILPRGPTYSNRLESFPM